MKQERCKICGTAFNPWGTKRRGGGRRKYCSRLCANTARRGITKVSLLQQRRACAHCAGEFTPKDARRRFCSRQCSDMERNQRASERQIREVELKTKRCVSCGKLFIAKRNSLSCSENCQKEYRAKQSRAYAKRKRLCLPVKKEMRTCNHCSAEFLIAYRRGSGLNRKWCSKKCRKANDNHRHKGIPKGMLSILILRQSSKCATCKHKFTRNPMRIATIDHIVPRAKGGTNEIENLQALCFLCNSLKSDRLGVQLRLCI